MSAQAANQATNISTPANEDLLEKQYHTIGIQSVAAAMSCASKKKAAKKKADYLTLSEEIMTD
ncbi:hypothetical protein [Cohaesibacter gelatinilyticus]|uniref:Uncharacterized protein n=1 Tax=Cohaesibacter gelatinilyticus TaxID=372072 RepID=A0A285NA61_9HYPH|nr:hypothetical protein [Cohaesibacter gelatinilyticus]SNZ06362.1 hypothetical protein SAMN06265368_0394 [Cohaesibacter gelatinilyticus]